MFWSNALAQAFLREIPDSALLASWSSSGQESEAEDLRHELVLWSETDEQMRKWIAGAWRAAHGGIVEATERLSPEEIGSQPSGWFERLSHEGVLLAVMSEVAEDTAQDVEQVLLTLSKGPDRSALQACWSAWQDPQPPETAKRIALIGGHSSEAPRVRSLEQRFDVQFKWTPAEKSKGLSPGHNVLRDLESVEAMIVVTGNVGHSTMHCARKAAGRMGIPCRYIETITERRLQQGLEAVCMEGSH